MSPLHGIVRHTPILIVGLLDALVGSDEYCSLFVEGLRPAEAAALVAVELPVGRPLLVLVDVVVERLGLVAHGYSLEAVLPRGVTGVEYQDGQATDFINASLKSRPKPHHRWPQLNQCSLYKVM